MSREKLVDYVQLAAWAVFLVTQRYHPDVVGIVNDAAILMILVTMVKLKRAKALEPAPEPTPR